MTSRPDVEQQFEAWAHVAARLRQRPREDKLAILEELGLDESYWRDVNEAWAKSLNEDIAAGRMARPYRYAQICKAELARRSDSAPAGADFRDSLTPPGHPRVPLSYQPETQPGPSEDEDPTLTHRAAPNTQRFDPNEGPAPPPDDFRRELVPVEKPLAEPTPHQIDTVEGGEGAHDLVEAARQANTAALWPLEKWATLCADLERLPEQADRLWSELGVTNPRARPHIRTHWKRKLANNPSELERFKALVAHRLSSPGA